MLEYGRVSDGCKRSVEFFMSKATTLFVLLAAGAAGFLGAASATPVASPWMTEEAMRAAFIGKTLDGHYGNGATWTETYLADGRLDYREAQRRAVGNWYFRGHVFCTFYDPSPAVPPLSGGCWTATKVGANCYEFYLASLAPEAPFEDDLEGANRRWNARGWRQGEPSTCHDKPSV
jgi:hypothetical protein